MQGLLIKVWIHDINSKVSFHPQAGFEELALTPPLGWNNWNTFRMDIHEDLVKEVVEIFEERGL